jgi:hypothetical protein
VIGTVSLIEKFPICNVHRLLCNFSVTVTKLLLCEKKLHALSAPEEVVKRKNAKNFAFC